MGETSHNSTATPKFDADALKGLLGDFEHGLQGSTTHPNNLPGLQELLASMTTRLQDFASGKVTEPEPPEKPSLNFADFMHGLPPDALLNKPEYRDWAFKKAQ